MTKFTKEQLTKLTEIHLLEVDGIDLDVHINADWVNLWAYDSKSIKSVASELVIHPDENFDQRIQSFLEKVKQVNHD